ncbi:MAG TPA: hypothetical protein VHA57_09025 [Actinomycetota bacterium]|nr:hypothetical protein [Actinomycetota bacterium]
MPRGGFLRWLLAVGLLAAVLAACTATTSSNGGPAATSPTARARSGVPVPATPASASPQGVAATTPPLGSVAPARTPAPAVVHTTAPTVPAVPATTVPAAPPATSAAPAPACTPLSDSGTCYEPGEYCRTSDHGEQGVAGDGKTIVCEDNNGWRWEPVP